MAHGNRRRHIDIGSDKRGNQKKGAGNSRISTKNVHLPTVGSQTKLRRKVIGIGNERNKTSQRQINELQYILHGKGLADLVEMHLHDNCNFRPPLFAISTVTFTLKLKNVDKMENIILA